MGETEPKDVYHRISYKRRNGTNHSPICSKSGVYMCADLLIFVKYYKIMVVFAVLRMVKEEFFWP